MTDIQFQDTKVTINSPKNSNTVENFYSHYPNINQHAQSAAGGSNTGKVESRMTEENVNISSVKSQVFDPK